MSLFAPQDLTGNLCPPPPYNLSASCDETKFGNIDFDDCSSCQDSQLGVERILRVLLDTNDWQLNGNTKLLVRDVRLLIS
jgi:hypothetical protein